MRQALIFSLFFCLGLSFAPNLAQAQPGDDWTVKRDPFDRKVIARYKAILDRNPGDTRALRKLVTLYKRYRTLDKLVGEYRAAFAKHPDRFSTALVLGHLALEQNDADSALSYYEKAAALRPDSPLVQVGLGDLYSRAGQNDKARTAFEVALAHTKSRTIKKEVLRKLASLALGASDIAGAKKFYEQYLALDPKNIDMRIELGDALAQHDQYDQAVEVYKKTESRLRTDPARRVEVISRIGQVYEKAGKTDLAVREYRRAMSLVGKSYYLRKELTARIIEIYRGKQALADLIASYEKEWPKRKRDHFEWDTLARLYEETGAQEQAIEAYRIATKKNPYELDTHRRLIALLENSGREKEAIKQYETVIKVAPGEPRFQLDLASRYWDHQQEAKAVALLKKMESRFPSDGSVYSAIADLYTRWGKEDLALQAYIRLTKIEPDDISHLVDLGEQYFQRAQKAKAMAVWKQIIRHKTGVNYARLGEVYAEHDLLTDALKMYRQAIKMQPDHPEHYKGRGRVYERKRNWKAAVDDWEQVLALTKKTKANKPARREARRRVVSLLQRWPGNHLRNRITSWRAAFLQEPPDLEAGYFLVEAYLGEHNEREARSTLERLLTLNANDVDSMQELAKLYRRDRQYDKAVALLLKLVELSPGREREFYTQIAEIKTDAREDDEAIKYVQMALEKSPNDPIAHQRLAERYEAMQDEAAIKKAIAAYQRTIELDPRNFKAYFALARLYEKEQPIEATKLYREVLKRATDDETIETAGRKAITVEELTRTLGGLERVISPLAFTFSHKTVYRRILVELYSRYVPFLVKQEQRGGADGLAARAELERLGQHGLKPLLEALNDDKDVNQQQIAVAVLGHLGNKGAAAPLVRLAQEPPRKTNARVGTLIPTLDFDVRVEALVAAGRLGDPRTIPALIALSQHRERAMREAAIFALGRTGDRKAVPPLLAALDDNRASVQVLACLGLAHGGDKVVDRLIQVVRDPDRQDDARAACAYALGVVGDKRAVPTLIETLQTGNDQAPRLAAWALGQIGDKRALPALLAAHFDRHESVRTTVAWALARIAGHTTPSAPADQGLYKMRTHTFDAEATVAALPGPIQPPELVPDLILGHEEELVAGIRDALGRHTDLQVRMLGELDARPDRIGLGSLTAELSRATPAEQKKLEAAIARVAVALVPDLERLTHHRDSKVRGLALSVLAKIDQARVADIVRAGLEDPDASVRKQAMRAAARLVVRHGGDPKLVAAVVEHLSARDWRERTDAARALGDFGQFGDETALIGALEDDYGFVREAAARSLGRVGSSAALPALGQIASADPHESVRNAARDAARLIKERKK